jgi:hypothetical protein
MAARWIGGTIFRVLPPSVKLGIGLLCYSPDAQAPTNTPVSMAKGGSQNYRNEWSQRANEQKEEKDPCVWLRKMYQRYKDSAERQKIKLAKKALNCRANSTGDKSK